MQYSHFTVEYKTRLRGCVLQFGVAPLTCFPFFTKNIELPLSRMYKLLFVHSSDSENLQLCQGLCVELL